MTYKRQPHDSIHDPIPLTFVEWMHQWHTRHNTSLAEGWEQYRQARRKRLAEQIAQTAHERMTDPEDIDCNGDVILYSTLDYSPGEPESNKQAQARARELLEEDAEPLTDREIVAVFRRLRWLSEEGDVV